jgi:catechol 2,3-dioxygenase-like lactoylglutathione lyase family enzyme
MKIMPVVKCSDLRRSLAFYTGVLDFERTWPEVPLEIGVVDIVLEGAEIQLSIHAGDGHFGSTVMLRVEDVDARFVRYVARGLDTRSRPESLIHCGPVDQTWGVREFVAEDPDGNSMRFGQVIGKRS